MEKIKKNIVKLKQNLPAGTTLKEAVQRDILRDTFPSSDSSNEKTRDVVYSLVKTEK